MKKPKRIGKTDDFMDENEELVTECEKTIQGIKDWIDELDLVVADTEELREILLKFLEKRKELKNKVKDCI